MGRTFTILAMTTFGIALSAAVSSSFAEAEGPCVAVYPEARFNGVGFNHIVHFANACTTVAECVVATDVNPEPQSVTVPPRSETEINTFLGSPSRVFVPKVTCKMHP